MTDINKMYTEFATKLIERKKAYDNAISKFNSIEQDLLHLLENENCDAITMVEIAKKLQENRRERRQSKVCIDQINSIISGKWNLDKPRNLTKFEEKMYTYKSNIVESLKHKPKLITRCKNK